MNVVFLDVDGVLNNDTTKEKTSDWSGTQYTGIDDTLVQNLAELVHKTGAQIVLTSSWKTLWDEPGPNDEMNPMAKYLVLKLKKQGLHIADRTIDRDKGDRGYGIKRWLKRFPEVERWVVLDDQEFLDYEVEGILPHLIKTNFLYGLTEENVKEAIDFLTQPCNKGDSKRHDKS